MDQRSIIGRLAAAVVLAGSLVGLWRYLAGERIGRPESAICPGLVAPAFAPVSYGPPAGRWRAASVSVIAPPDRERESRSAVIREILRLLTERPCLPDREQRLKQRLGELLELAPAALTDLLASVRDGNDRLEVLRLVSRLWGATDFPQAVAWAAELADPQERRFAFEAACLADGDSDPGEAIEAWRVFDPDVGSGAFGSLVQRWAQRDPGEALQWARAQDPAVRDVAVARVAFVLAGSQPELAAGLGAGIENGPVRDEAVISVLHIWLGRDRSGAIAWLSRQPRTSLTARAWSEVVSSTVSCPPS